MRNTYDASDIARLLDHLVTSICVEFQPENPLNIVGIRTRGETLAQRLATLLAARGFSRIFRGVLDITLYRDDLSEIGPRPLVQPTQIDVPLDGVPCVLVDDVIFTGRSVRAALNLLNDFGRPKVIRLAVLVDRGGRELPIQPDYVGVTLGDVPPTYRVKVRLNEVDGVDEVVAEARK